MASNSTPNNDVNPNPTNNNINNNNINVDLSTQEVDNQNNTRKPRKRFVGTKSKQGNSNGGSNIVAKNRSSRRLANQIPDDILSNQDLTLAIKALPSNYNFEIR